MDPTPAPALDSHTTWLTDERESFWWFVLVLIVPAVGEVDVVVNRLLLREPAAGDLPCLPTAGANEAVGAASAALRPWLEGERCRGLLHLKNAKKCEEIF